MAEKKIHAGKRRSSSDAINYLCTQQCQCLPNYSALLKDIKSSQTLITNSRFHNSTCQGNSTTFPTNNNNLASQVEEIKASTEAAKAATTSGSSHGLMEVELQVEGLKHVPKSVSFVPRNQEITPPDQYSQTVGAIKGKRKADDEPPLSSDSESSSLYSLHTTNSTSDNYEEPADVLVKRDKLAQKGTGIKRRRRNAEIHNLHERKRRDKINKKMRMLKELIPNCNKMDKASMLDDAIEYLKALKSQLQIMSMGLFRMPLMMLPTATPHMMMMSTPHLHHLMGFRSPLPVINDNNGVRMFGFPNQMPPMPTSPLSMVTNPSIQPLLSKSSIATKMAQNQAFY